MPTIKGPSGEFYLDVSRGRHPGMSMVHKYGRNSAVPNGTWAGILQARAQFYWPTVAATVRIKAGGNVADTAAAGDGARSITVEGLDENGNPASAVIPTAGASASDSSVITFLRVHRAYITSLGVGTYSAANTGNIMIEDGTNDLITILAGEGQTQYCGYTIPANKTGYLVSIKVDADAAKAADFRLYTRTDIDVVAAPMSPKRLKSFWDGVLGSVVLKPKSPILELASLTDIWLEARGGGAGTEVSGDMEILLVEID